MTKAEACLWKYALRNKMMGVIFNRQRPILNYIADFMCKELKLIIEVDGFSHTFEKVIENDKIRQDNLERMGYKIVRFSDKEVLTNIQQVRNRIFEIVTELKNKEEY
jgi:very-short-patch-repair endonuclease